MLFFLSWSILPASPLLPGGLGEREGQNNSTPASAEHCCPGQRSARRSHIHAVAKVRALAGPERPQLRRLRALTGRPRLVLVDGIDSVAEAGGGTARHTRAPSANAHAVVACFRRLRLKRTASNALSSAERGTVAGQGWAAPGPFEAAQQWPTTTNDDH